MKKIILCVMVMVSISFLSKAQGGLWGVAQGGKGFGVIFKTNVDGSGYEPQKYFTSTAPGASAYGGLLQAANGKLYGLTSFGGTYGEGVLFEYDAPNASYVLKYEFDNDHGALPYGTLIQASNNKLYGLASGGGAYYSGVLFEYDIDNGTYNTKYEFDDLTGSVPLGDLFEASNGKLYGLTFAGGTNGSGVLFEYDPVDETYVVKYNFDLSDPELPNTGNSPKGNLIELNGKLYGLAQGGASGNGVVFEYDLVSEEYTDKLDFDGNVSLSNGSLVEHNGLFYGLSTYGGSSNAGTIFSYDPVTNDLQIKHEFETDAGFPRGSLIEGSDGKLYGSAAGEQFLSDYAGFGILFDYDPDLQVFTIRHSFHKATGSNQRGSILEADNGKFYGLTPLGGKKDVGVLFEFDPANDNYIDKIDFSATPEASNPSGHLILGSDKKLYGLTHDGGDNELGTLFSIDPVTKAFTKKYDFAFESGCSPSGSLIEHDGKLFGVTSIGGSSTGGVIFKFDPVAGTYTHYDLSGTVDGATPLGNLVKVPNGKMYGLGWNGGDDFSGTIFEFDPVAEIITPKHSFDETDGGFPYGSLVLADNGKLYGMTSEGGSNFVGTLFEFDPLTSNFIKRLNFGGNASAARPIGSLLSYNGKLFGMTLSGGANDVGAIFEFDPLTGSFKIDYDFDYTYGGAPDGSLIQANGKLYGLTESGGANDYGVLFEYDPVNNIYVDKYDFDEAHGGSPVFDLLFIDSTPVADEGIADQQAAQYLPFDFTFSASVFNDPDGDQLNFTATLVSGAPLPEWLHLNSDTRTFAGTPLKTDNTIAVRLTATDPSGEKASQDFSIHISVITGTETSAENLLVVSPNPAADRLNIQFNGDGKMSGSIKVTSSVGRMVMTRQIDSLESIQLDVSTLSPDVYVLEITSGGKAHHIKFVKK
jgi:uncharacterized repeat protein (TIGR03803 family)